MCNPLSNFTASKGCQGVKDHTVWHQMLLLRTFQSFKETCRRCATILGGQTGELLFNYLHIPHPGLKFKLVFFITYSELFFQEQQAQGRWSLMISWRRSTVWDLSKSLFYSSFAFLALFCPFIFSWTTSSPRCLLTTATSARWTAEAASGIWRRSRG